MIDDLNNVEDQIRAWALRANTAIMNLLPLCAPIRDIEADPSLKRVMMLLSTACWGTTQTLLYLVAGFRLWDAEVLARSLTEGTVKFGYILELPLTFAERAAEYRYALPSIAKLRWHARAKAALDASPSNTHESELRPFRDLLVPDAELASIREQFPRDVRANLERRWGFTELVETVSREGGAFGPHARALLHHYSLASHLYHMSYEGVDMPLERDQRGLDRKVAIQLVHASKLLASSYNLAVLRIAVLNKFRGIPNENLHVHNQEIKPFLEELDAAYDKWSAIEYPGF